MKLSELKDRVVINVNNGEKLGVLGRCDLKIDSKEGTIKAILIPKGGIKNILSLGSEYINIPWENIVKIGMDTIMVELKE